MLIKIAVFAAYFLVVLMIGIVARTRWKSTPESYFLANRRLGTLVLLGTMVATNFSAFTVFGTSGAGYRDGYAFFPIMGFGTGFMAITFWIIGRRIWQIGRSNGVVTPPELIRHLYGSQTLSFIFAVVMVVFTIPYLALQPMAAGYALEELLGLPYFAGCVLVTVIILLYTLRGGMRAVAWTDLFQGVVMFIMLLVSLVVVLRYHGGFAAANQEILSLSPELFSRPGGLGKYSPGIWLSFMMLWFFCDPMFPQLFQRFFAARSRQTIDRIMLLYPLVCTVVFSMPIAIGVIGRLTIPDLTGKQADRILPMLMTSISGDVMATLVIAAGMAALMSTMDSQLLTLSSIFTRDVLPLVRRGKKEESATGRLFVVFLGLMGLALAYRPPATILQIATQTFTGLAVLFPTVIFGLYFRRRYVLPAILSIVCGEAVLVAFYLKWLPNGGFLPVVWVMLTAFAAYLLPYLYLVWREGAVIFFWPAWLRSPFTFLLGSIFILSIDVWSWNKTQPLLGGIPAWIWYFVGLSALQTAVMAVMVHGRKRPRSVEPVEPV
ncbi:MAG: sodium:solute symporter family protein [Desulfobacterales bacterium]|jgi:SSS family solute:Na+ symporter